MRTIIDFFLNNPTLLISIIVFFICVIIGFFGDQYLKKNKIKEVKSKSLNKNEDVSDSTDKTKETIDIYVNNIDTMYDVNYNDNDVNAEYDTNHSINNVDNMNDTNYNTSNINDININSNYVFNKEFAIEPNAVSEPNMIIEPSIKEEAIPPTNSVNIDQNNKNSYINNDDNYTNMF